MNRYASFRMLIVSALAALAALGLTGCFGPRIELPPPSKEDTKSRIELLTQEKEAATQMADDLIKTSQQAKDEITKQRRDIAAAQELIAEKEGRIKSLTRLQEELRNQEIASEIRKISWYTVATGAALLVFGVLLMIFGNSPAGAVIMAATGGKTAIYAIAGGAVVLGLGLFGLWAAPHWIWGAWIAGAAVAAAVAGVILKVLRDKILENAQGHTAVALAAEYGDKMEALVKQAQQMLEPAAAQRLEQALKDSKITAAVDQARNRVHGLIDNLRKIHKSPKAPEPPTK
jgi:hypothetical protein